MTAVVELHHEIEGTGPDLVLLHGGAGGIGDLAGLRARIGTGRRVIAPDQRGHGRSPDPGELSYAAMAGDTAALLDLLGVSGADVVGWSDGAVVALLVARDRPELFGRIVAVSGNAAMSSDPSPLTPEAEDYLARMQSNDLPLPAGRDQLPGGVASWPATAERIVGMWRAGPDLSFDDLGRVSVPVLYLAADRDIVPLAHTAGMFEATPGAQLAILPQADHRLVQHRVDEVGAIIERFLGG
jgi:pimeloyl-ACP methyl ester carboxylesterase